MAQVVGELTFVQLEDDDPAELREDVAPAVRQRVDVVEMCERHAFAFGAVSYTHLDVYKRQVVVDIFFQFFSEMVYG